MAYETHRNVDTPEDDTTIWRYMNFAKFVSILHDNSLCFSRLDLLGGPFEGAYSRNRGYRVGGLGQSGR
jgi:hypothetical protein